MKDKILKSAPALLILAAGAGMCYGLFYLVDNIWNGTFVDWFSDNYMYTHNEYWNEADTWIITEPRWPKVKVLLFTVLIITVLLGLCIVLTAAYLNGRNEQRKTVTKASAMIRRYMQGNQDANEVFPKEYAEISAEMSQIKSVMERHEQVLKEEAMRKNDLITYLAHDLKTPLTSVIGYLSLLEEASDMPKEQREKYIRITLQKACRLETLTNEFFEITRFNLQQMELEKERVDLYYMLVQLTDEFYPILHEHGNTANLKADEELTVYADPDKLARVFHNILKNAVAYSYPDTQIQIHAWCEEKEVCISFKNQGKTIPRQKLERIFEKFFRADDTRSSHTGGAGLGLAIAREIVALHKGTITAESENEVTTFLVTLPLV